MEGDENVFYSSVCSLAVLALGMFDCGTPAVDLANSARPRQNALL